MAHQTILVVDDEPQIVELVGDYLKQAGFRVVTAGDGQTALTLARHERPDLVVLDLMLPELDGFEVLERLRASPQTADVPVLVLTVKARPADRRKALEMGADGYLVKPHRSAELVSLVGSLLREGRGGGGGPEGA